MSVYLLVVSPIELGGDQADKDFLNHIGANPEVAGSVWTGVVSVISKQYGDLWANLFQMNDEHITAKNFTMVTNYNPRFDLSLAYPPLEVRVAHRPAMAEIFAYWHGLLHPTDAGTVVYAYDCDTPHYHTAMIFEGVDLAPLSEIFSSNLRAAFKPLPGGTLQ